MHANPLFAAAATLLLASASGLDAASAEPVRHAGRNVTYPKSLEITAKDDETEHLAGTFVRDGVTFHTEGPRAGQVSTIVITGSFDFTGGVGPYEAEIVRTFANDETLTLAIQGERMRVDGELSNAGSYRCVDGTGSLAGAACEGTYTSRQLRNRMSLVEWQGELTVPGS
jgi:hypothetical protein